MMYIISFNKIIIDIGEHSQFFTGKFMDVFLTFGCSL